MIRLSRTRCHRNPSSKTRRGAAAVEMALVLPVFVTVTLGMIELGRGIMVAQLMTNAAREAARTAIIDGSTDTSVANVAKTFLQTAAKVNPSDVSVTITNASGGSVATAQPRDLITVNVSLPYSKVSWLPPKYLAGKSLSATSAMRHE
jgi:Flp pilus assembly protein TadG